jgi:hypothetical protein
MKKLLVVLLLPLLLSCTRSDASRETLEKAGYTDIEITGYSPLSCSDSDTFSTGFTAKNPKGDTVSGVVCCGWLKNCTIRF